MATISVLFNGCYKGFDIRNYKANDYNGRFGDLIGGSWYEVKGMGTFKTLDECYDAIDARLGIPPYDSDPED